MIKTTHYLLLLIVAVASLTSCSSLKPSAKYMAGSENENTTSSKGVRFLNVKSIEHSKTTTTQSSKITETAIAGGKKVTVKPKGSSENTSINTGNYSAIQIKYAEKLGVAPNELKNLKLYEAIEEWYGTRYRFGGTTHRGVDCSSLMQHLYKSAYNLNIPRTAVTQHGASSRINTDDLQEGDLVFFHTTRAGISHVGLYLGNRKFVHASSSRGVVISSLDETYYVPRYRGGGRFNKTYQHNGEELGENVEMEGTK